MMSVHISVQQFMFWLFICYSGLLVGQTNERGFRINGDARQLDSVCYQLTPDTMYMAGSMWNENQINLNQPFQIVVDMFFGCLDGDGADGLGFVLQPVSTTLGTNGEGLGFQDIAPSIGIEFDAFENFNLNDPAYDHLAIIRDGILDHGSPNNLAGPVTISGSSDNIEDCAWHNIKVTWDPVTQILEIFFDCESRLSYQGDIINDIFAGDPNVFWGFTAATGSLFNVQSVCFVYTSILDELPAVSLCEGDTFQVNLPDFLNYTWSSDPAISDINSPNPSIYPNSTSTFIVEISDDCDVIRTDTLNIQVESVELSLEIIEINCSTIDVLLSGSGGYPDYEFRLNENAPWPDSLFDDLQAGQTHRFYVTDSVGCMDSIFLSTDPPQYPSLDSVSIQSPSCRNDGIIELFGSIDTELFGLINSSGVSNPVFTRLGAGDYQFWIEGQQGCRDTSEIYHLEADTIQITNVSASDPDCDQDNGVIQVTAVGGLGNLTYELNDLVAMDQSVFTVGSGVYTITLSDSAGCSTSIGPITLDANCGLFIPNAFSPNGDGINDEWQIFTDASPLNQIDWLGIYDRLGNLVFHAQNQPFTSAGIRWDGRSPTGELYTSQVFTYILKYTNIEGEVETRSGDITLIR